MQIKPIRNRIVRACAAMAVMGSMMACGDSSSPSLADLEVTTTISRPEFKSGDTTTVTTTITNTSAQAVRIDQPFCVAYFEITRSDDVVAPGTPFCILSASVPGALAGGETREIKELWHGDNRAWQQPLSAGTYQLRGRVHTNIGAALSDPITINILP